MTIRRLFTVGVAAVATMGLSLTACASPSTTTTTPTDTGSAAASPADKTFTIGAAVIVTHPALQAVEQGFKDTLDQAGVKYNIIDENAQGDTSNAATIASSFAANKNIDLILAISTPIATAMAQAVQDRPILFSAVTDPVGAGLVPSMTQAGANITGTSDANPDAKPVDVVKQAMPNVKTIGVIYSSSETNSLAQYKEYQTEAAADGITLQPATVTSAADITTALNTLTGVDAILVPTDNTVVASIANVISFGQQKQIPVFCADDSTIPLGTVATQGLSYYALGQATGQMAVQILQGGQNVNTIAPSEPTTTTLEINPDAAASFGLTLPPSFLAQGVITTPSPTASS